MTLTLLLDMDDTLLVNDFDRFLPAYLQKLSAHLRNLVSPERMVPHLMAGTKAMIYKELPEKTLEAAFDDVFYAGIGLPKAQLSGSIGDFYARDYPALQSVTGVMPGAVEFVEWAFAQNYSIVIATNPLFPRSAIEQRLAWAGLPVSKYPFSLVTSYEKLHFAKPNPAYYAEIMGQMAWPEGPAAMVGNSLTEDIQPAQAIGLPAFHIRSEASSNGGSEGTFAQLKTWLKKIEGEEYRFPQTPQAITALLAGAPAALETLASGLEPDRWNRRPHAAEWSVGEILCHLRDVDAEVTLPRTLRLRQEENPFITAEPTDVWAEERQYIREEAAGALDGFLRERTTLLRALQQLSPRDWSRPARHAIFGPTTMSELLGFTVTHDQNHIRQVAKNIHWLKGE